MQPRFARLVISTLVTLGILIALEIGTSALLPALGWHESRLAFNVVIILFMAIKVSTPLLPWLILALQMVHAAFSVEGWALGTLAGVLISVAAAYLKEILQFSSAIATMAIVQVFQIAWWLLTAAIICLKLGSFEKFGLLFGNALPATFVLSIMSPLLFALLDRVWAVENEVGRTGVQV